VIVLAGTLASNHVRGQPGGVFAAVLAGAATLVLLLGRRQPVAAVLMCGLLVGLYFALGYVDGPIFLVVPTATLVVAIHHPSRRWGYAAAGSVVLVAVGLLMRGWDGDLQKNLWQGFLVAALVAAAGAAGTTIRGRREAAAERAQRAAAEEQLRMAHDLHDGVGHGLAVIALQSGVALHVLEKEDADVMAARRALEVIRETSRESLEALRAELSRLAPDVSAPRAAHRGLADLPVLVDRFRAGGLSVSLSGVVGSVPDQVDEVAYVIVQEALTNVLRHASANRAVVSLRTEPSELLVSVIDDGRGGEVVEGLGITGMRARVQRLGGSLSVGQAPEGFQVRAVLPLNGSA
jgi:signal transduction histidine kinase